MEQQLEAIEETDGIRLTWNNWPINKAPHAVVPIACICNLKHKVPLLPYEPIFCHSCQAVLSPANVPDYNSRTWTCVFCKTRNQFPPHIKDISEENKLPELEVENTSVEYALSKPTSFPPIFLLLIDRCSFDDSRHDLMKRGLILALENIPNEALVSIVLFGTNIELLNFDDREIKTIFCFDGRKNYTEKDVENCQLKGMGNFFVNKTENIEKLMNYLENLNQDPFPVMSGMRPIRCTGSAISFATSLLKPFHDSPAKIMIFTQGPCTYGPGQCFPISVAEKAADKFNLDSITSFYKELGERISSNGHSIDIIAETFADIGVKHLQEMTKITGGALIMAQDFLEEVKNNSIQKIFEKDDEGVMVQGFNAKILVKTSSNLVFKGFMGEGKPSGSGWKLGSVFSNSSIVFILEPNNPKFDELGYVQILSQYQRSDMKIVTKVTTFCRKFTKNREEMLNSFDQRAAIVFQSRIFLANNFADVRDFEASIDKSLIRFSKQYASYERGNPSSVYFPDCMDFYPRFMFFFRRSLVVDNEGISEDETAYLRNLLVRLPVNEAVKLIMPTLFCITASNETFSVSLDTDSLRPDAILILDSFHNVLMWKGQEINEMINNGLHLQPGNEALNEAYQKAQDVYDSKKDRLPYPQFKETVSGKSQERILLHFVNPRCKNIVKTERIDFNSFYTALCNHVVRGD